MLIPDVDDEEQSEVEAKFSPENFKDEDFIEVINWFSHEDQT